MNNISAFRPGSSSGGSAGGRHEGPKSQPTAGASDARGRAWRRIRRATVRIQEARKQQLKNIGQLAESDIETIRQMFDDGGDFDVTKLKTQVDLHFEPDSDDESNESV